MFAVEQNGERRGDGATQLRGLLSLCFTSFHACIAMLPGLACSWGSLAGLVSRQWCGVVCRYLTFDGRLDR